MRQLSLLLLLLLLAACGSEAPKAPEAVAVPIPPQLCEQAKAGLEKVKAKGGFEHDGNGSATIPQQAWIVMGTGGHGSLAQLLAYDAACNQPGGSPERLIVIRNELGVVLMERTVPTNAGLGSLEDE